jgi:preprotein translocase subunit SecD
LGNLQFTVADVRADLAIGEDDTARINIAMNETATAAFALFTKTHVNQSVAFFVCGQQMESVVVQAPIDSGYAVTGPLPVDVATEMVTALNDQGPCPD